MQGIVGTQKSYTGVPYTDGGPPDAGARRHRRDLQPDPGYGNVFGCRNGRNTSSNAASTATTTRG
jgi:hypothetical protein